MAVDIITDVYDKKSKQVVLFSSDTDLIPVLDAVKIKQIRVTYVCFAEMVNRAIAAVADETLTFTRKKIIDLGKI